MNWKEFKEKFAVDESSGSYKLTAYGCFLRHNRKRSEQYVNKLESEIRSFSRGLSRDEIREQKNYENIREGMTLDEIVRELDRNDDKSLKWR